MYNEAADNPQFYIFERLQAIANNSIVGNNSSTIPTGALQIVLDILAARLLPAKTSFIIVEQRLTVDLKTAAPLVLSKVLGVRDDDGYRIKNLIAAFSLRKWEVHAAKPPTSSEALQLFVIDNNRKTHGCFCRLDKCADGFKLALLLPDFPDNDIMSAKLYADLIAEVSGPLSKDAQLLQQVYDYIVLNTERPLPTNKELARMFFTNRQKLKVLFRNILKTSIYRFYNDTRIKRALELIQDTHLPLQDIAVICGFANYHHFSHLFNKHCGFRPGSVERKKR